MREIAGSSIINENNTRMYRRHCWNIDIKDVRRSFLVHRARIGRVTRKMEERILVPELCYTLELCFSRQ
ncbi:hypothetical protein HN011_011964 [Eciton burchellii]|nr:hypothetical protein HN011_011964 [Eciton burchellii]